MKQKATEADTLRQWLRDTADHDTNGCGCGACMFVPEWELSIPPFADHPGDSPSFSQNDAG